MSEASRHAAYESLTLNPEMHFIRRVITERGMVGADVSVEKLVGDVVEGMAIQMRRALYHHDSPRKIEVPVGWWDFIKAGVILCPWCPDWLRRKIQYRVNTFVARQAFPEFVPERLGPNIIYFHQMEHP